MSRIRFAVASATMLCLATLISGPGPVQADTPAVKPVTPAAQTLLTLTGTVDGKPGTQVTFDMAALQKLPEVSFTTTTIWTQGPQTFTGVPLAAVLKAAKMTGTSLQATAANDYAVQIPIEDWGNTGPIIAYKRNGKTMTLRDKGPLWIVYPYDSNPAFRTEVIYTRSIWQLDRIDVRP